MGSRALSPGGARPRRPGRPLAAPAARSSALPLAASFALPLAASFALSCADEGPAPARPGARPTPGRASALTSARPVAGTPLPPRFAPAAPAAPA
ncbi:MAG TPA: hypothetical protein VFS00_15110, partial [Polyangiaceae bacterium]|nr:hypothetical protein [Polyangiaceae bacterium]